MAFCRRRKKSHVPKIGLFSSQSGDCWRKPGPGNVLHVSRVSEGEAATATSRRSGFEQVHLMLAVMSNQIVVIFADEASA